MSETNNLSGWVFPEDIVVSKTNFVPGHMTIAHDSEALISPVFEDRDAAFEWLKDEVAMMHGNAIFDIEFSDMNDQGEHWFSGRAALIAKRESMASSDDALESKHYARSTRQAFQKELARVNKERAEEKAAQAAYEAQRKRRKAILMKVAACVAVLSIGSGLVYALPV